MINGHAGVDFGLGVDVSGHHTAASDRNVQQHYDMRL